MLVKERLSLSVSFANRKMGVVPSVSLPPGRTCRPDAPCVPDCYARVHMYDLKVRPNIKRAWDRNLLIWEEDPDFYFDCIYGHLLANPDPHFRLHVGGDVPDGHYLFKMLGLARKLPRTTFLCFSKRYEFLEEVRRVPENLKIIVSAWPGLEMPSRLSRRFPIAWMQDGSEERVPKNAHRCQGLCSHCYSCWNLRAGSHIVFHKR